MDPRQTLQTAIAEKNVDRVAEILTNYRWIVDKIFPDTYIYPLTQAIRSSWQEGVRVLLMFGSAITESNPLIEAIKSRDVHMVQLMVEFGYRNFDPKEGKEFPLDVAIRTGSFPIFEYLISMGANLDPIFVKFKQEIIHRVAEGGSVNICKVILPKASKYEWGSHLINVKRNEYGSTPLQIAVRKGHLEMVEFLHRQGGHVDTRDGSTESSPSPSPLADAASNGDLEMIKLLVRLKYADMKHRWREYAKLRSSIGSLSSSELQAPNFDIVPFLDYPNHGPHIPIIAARDHPAAIGLLLRLGSRWILDPENHALPLVGRNISLQPQLRPGVKIFQVIAASPNLGNPHDLREVDRAIMEIPLTEEEIRTANAQIYFESSLTDRLLLQLEVYSMDEF